MTKTKTKTKTGKISYMPPPLVFNKLTRFQEFSKSKYRLGIEKKYHKTYINYEFTMDLAPMHLCYVCAVV